eukprot:gene5884-5788_t
MGAHARFGGGDVQWMTAGTGIVTCTKSDLAWWLPTVHAEMFPLVNADKPNPLELFQVWLNLPAKDKHVAPYFTMMWDHQLPRFKFEHDGAKTEVVTICGALEPESLPAPPPNSWAAQEQAAVSVWTIKMEPGAKWSLPAALPGLNHTLYVYRGNKISIEGHIEAFTPEVALRLKPDAEIPLSNTGNIPAEMLLLQGRPIGEPVAKHGPFVMNTQQEIQQAFQDYRNTGFGGWPWPSDAPTHPRESGRFAVHSD